jgi:hypothetical protein
VNDIQKQKLRKARAEYDEMLASVELDKLPPAIAQQFEDARKLIEELEERSERG